MDKKLNLKGLNLDTIRIVLQRYFPVYLVTGEFIVRNHLKVSLKADALVECCVVQDL